MRHAHGQIPPAAQGVDWTQPLPLRYLMAGELLLCREPCAVTTVLGSCVAITMFDARSGLAAICHAMLPAPAEHGDVASPRHDAFRFVSHALPAMIEFFSSRSVDARRAEVKLFGGGNVLQQPDRRWCGQSVGDANVRMARDLCQTARLRVVAADLGGAVGRKIIFNTLSGRVLLKYVASAISGDAGRETFAS